MLENRKLKLCTEYVKLNINVEVVFFRSHSQRLEVISMQCIVTKNKREVT